MERFREKNLDHMLEREEEAEEEGYLQTCTSINTLNLIVIQEMCPQICDKDICDIEVLGVIGVHFLLCVSP